jgi:hypothetical protein
MERRESGRLVSVHVTHGHGSIHTKPNLDPPASLLFPLTPVPFWVDQPHHLVTIHPFLLLSPLSWEPARETTFPSPCLLLLHTKPTHVDAHHTSLSLPGIPMLVLWHHSPVTTRVVTTRARSRTRPRTRRLRHLPSPWTLHDGAGVHHARTHERRRVRSTRPGRHRPHPVLVVSSSSWRVDVT